MKKSNLITLLAMALAFAACSPETFTMNVEMRNPSRSGLNLFHKTMSIVYFDDGELKDTAFVLGTVEGFARKMEEDYFGGQPSIKIYKIPAESDSISRHRKMVDLIMDTGDDVVFLFDKPQYGTLAFGNNSVTLPFKMKVSAYDSQNSSDKVFAFNGSSSVVLPLSGTVSADPDEMEERFWKEVGWKAEQIGSKATANFVSTWKMEQFTLYYYEEAKWEKASQAAYEHRWNDAIKMWMTISQSTNDYLKKACAEYDIAVGCFMQEQYALALKWLARADSDAELTLSPGLRRRIVNRMGN